MNGRVFSIAVLTMFVAFMPNFVGYGSEDKYSRPPEAISFTYVPEYGSSENLRGRVNSHDPKRLVVAVYIMVNGGFWNKPSWDEPLTTIQSGSWVCDITTGGVDETATQIVAYLIPSGYQPPLAAGVGRLPANLEERAIAKAMVSRSKEGQSPPVQEVRVEGKGVVPSTRVISGFCYGPFRKRENPDAAILPTASEIATDMKLIRRLTSAIRTYGCTGTLSTIPEYCEIAGIDCYVGAWLGRYKTVNKKEIESAITIANKKLACVKALIIGNECLLRKDLSEEELIAYIRKVKSATDIQVTTAEIWPVWQNHPRLADEVDFVTAHVHPYWENVPIEAAAKHVLELWRSLRRQFPNRRVVIGETGFPSAGQKQGKAVPSNENQGTFFREFTSLARAEQIDHFYFEIMDEDFKSAFERGAGAHWGIFNADGSLKSHMRGLVPPDAAKGIRRPPRELKKTKVTAPLVVYRDADSEENGFYPSGWMGDQNCIYLDDAYPVNPRSGRTCIRISYDIGRSPTVKIVLDKEGLFDRVEYTESDQLWAGVYWQFPLNNLGDYPGYELAGATKLTFWARGERGGENAVFKCGGVSDSKKPFRDSFGPIEKSVELTKKWTKYTVDISGQDTGHVIGGFCWTTSLMENRWSTSFVQAKRCVIYLDDIVFE